MKFGVVVFPGSNCDDDMIHVLGDVLGANVTKLWHKDHDLKGLSTDDCIVIPGGFSYGDYLRSGAIARFSHVMTEVIKFARNGGKVLGICNGFQVLCEAGLLPGTLLKNENQKFICKNIYLKSATENSALNHGIDSNQALKIPIAHADGRFYATPDALREIEDNDQVLFRYCDENTQVQPSANPNGSLNNIAGICNVERNVFGMMPHPERAAEPIFGNTDGMAIFESLLELKSSAIS